MIFSTDVSKRRLAGIVLLIIAALCLAAGLVLPILRFERLYFFSETPSLIELVASLWRGGDEGLAIVVGLFSIALPIAKLAWLSVEMISPHRAGGFPARMMPVIARWSMMDVMLVALVVFAAKTSGFAVAITQPGLWFYAASALLAGALPSFIPRS